jgi:hypothetical protein
VARVRESGDSSRSTRQRAASSVLGCQSSPADPDAEQSRSESGSRMSSERRVNLVKVFSATKARERDEHGDRVTQWLRSRPGLKTVDTVVQLSSDRECHCLSIVLLCSE